MSRLRLLSLDLTGTIYKFAAPPFETYASFAKERNLPIRDEKIKGSFLRAYQKAKADFPNFGLGSLSSSREWWSRIVLSTFRGALANNEILDMRIARRVADELYDFYTLPEAYFMYPDVKDFLHNLRSLNIKTCVISNSDRRIHKILEGLGIKEYFDFILSSEEVGIMKPNVRIFEEALNRANIEGTTSLTYGFHIGDDLEKDYFAPRQDPRWKSCLIQREGKVPPHIDARDVYSNLNDLYQNNILLRTIEFPITK